MSDQWSVVVVGIEGGNFTVKVAANEDEFLKTTIKRLKQKIYEVKSDVEPDEMRLLYAGKQLEEVHPTTKVQKTLRDYNLHKGCIITVVIRCHGGTDRLPLERVPVPPRDCEEEKEHDFSNFSLQFTDDPDCIDPFSDETPKRVKMKCGHAVNPKTLTAYCRSQLDDHFYTFTCPALVDGYRKKCGKEWDYEEVRQVALLTDDEMKYFEAKISEYAAMTYCEMKECPKCRSFVERMDLNNLRVTCPVCTKKKGSSFDFCWHCSKEWSGPTTSSEKCGNPDCIHPGLPSIRDAPMIKLNGVDVPNRRACPTCGKVVEHNQEGCKMMMCRRCKKEFCFLCLCLSTDCLNEAPNSWHNQCKKPVAPRQTVIPVWSRN